MAKKTGKGEFSFSKIGDIIKDISVKSNIIVDDSDGEGTFIGTGIYMLNALFSKSILKGGVPTSRITALAGESGVGKSYLCYNIAREAQKQGYSVIYIDTEFSIQKQDLKNYGIDISDDRCKLLRSNKVEEIKVFLTQLLDQLKKAKADGYELPKVILFLDSAGQLASRKEVEDAIEGKDKADMSRAKAIKSLFRIINGDLGVLNIPMVVTNHTYFTQDFMPKEVMSGGTGLVYSASTIVFMSKAKLKTGEEDELDLSSSGIIVTAKSQKNRMAKPKKVKFHIDFSSGCNPYVGLDYFCTPENFELVGVAQGKVETNKIGEARFIPGGNRWYVAHLNKSVTTNQLFSSKVFTPQVLEALEPIIYDYFKYSSSTEIEQTEKEYEEMVAEEEKLYGTDLEEMDSDEFFN